MQQALTPGLLLTITQVASAIQVEPKTIRRWSDDGKFPRPIDLNGQIRWESTEVLEWVMEQKISQKGTSVCPPQHDFEGTSEIQERSGPSKKTKTD